MAEQKLRSVVKDQNLMQPKIVGRYDHQRDIYKKKTKVKEKESIE